MADRRPSKRQLEWLILLSSVDRICLTPDAASRALVRRGLLREDAPDGAFCIAAAGLRRLAEEMEAGRMDDALTRMRAEAAKRRGEDPPARRDAPAPHA